MATPDLLGAMVAHYRIEAELGRGGMGEVYRAYDTRLSRPVALKFLPQRGAPDEAAVDRFLLEARAASALNHPNIVTIHEIGESDGRRFIVMELIAGRTLREMMHEGCAPASVLDIGAQIARALAVAHAAGIVHRDIKPENIMVRQDGYAKVLDFGIARMLPADALATLTLETPGALLGTLRYMSPEQARGEVVAAPTDIFSLGVVLYELATGRHPFAADSHAGVLHAVLSAQPLPASRINPQVPPQVDAHLARMLEKDHRLRPTAEEISAAFSTGAVHSDIAPAPFSRHTVGRKKELAELGAAFDSVAAGRGLLVGVAGEPGIGKTTLVEDFLAGLPARQCAASIARGRCSERLAGSEAYLPFLEALESLLHGDAGSEAARLMKLLAPSWYVQVAPLASDDSSAERLLAETKTTTQERMKRELVAFFREVSRSRPLILFFDDLHWADISTVDLLAYAGDRLESLPLLIVATYRAADLMLARHPFLDVKLRLQSRGACREIAVDFLTREDVEAYIALEFPEHRLPAEFVSLAHSTTEGSPLFLADLLRYLRDRGLIAERDGRWALAQSIPDIRRELPESIRSMIERKISQLTDAGRRLLLAAAVEGHEFDSAIVSEVLEADAAEIEEQLEVLDRVHSFVRRVGEHEFPDRTLAVRYRFVHILYQNALYGSLTPTRRASLSARVAQTLLRHSGPETGPIASELALLFEAARDFSRSADYFLAAAGHAMRVFAHNEAIALAQHGLAMVSLLPDTPDRARRELSLQMALGPAEISAGGPASRAAEKAFVRARELSEALGDTRHLFFALSGAWNCYLLRAEMKRAHETAERCISLARQMEDAALLVVAHSALGQTLFYMGEFAPALESLDEGIRLYDRAQHAGLAFLHGEDPGVGCRTHSAWALWHLGYPDRALARIRDADALARHLARPFERCYAHGFAAKVHQLRGESAECRHQAEELMALSKEAPFWLAMAKERHGWSLVQAGQVNDGRAEMREGLNAWLATDSQLDWIYDLMRLAETWLRAADTAQASACVSEAFSAMEQNDERYCEAEVYRLKGDVLLAEGAPDAQKWFRQALETAQSQQAKSLELRAASGLHRSLNNEESRCILREVYAWFTEGFDTADLCAAKALLDSR